MQASISDHDLEKIIKRDILASICHLLVHAEVQPLAPAQKLVAEFVEQLCGEKSKNKRIVNAAF